MGRPVVPDEYSMVAPCGWSVSGRAGAAAMVVSYESYPGTGPPKASRSLTAAVWSSIASAVAACSADTISAAAPESLTM